MEYALALLIALTPWLACGAASSAQEADLQEQTVPPPPANADRARDTPRATEIIGLPVIDPQERNLGRVYDLIIGVDGRVSYLILARGGVIGLGDRLCAIPWGAIRPEVHEKKLIVDISKERLEGAPQFANWAEFRSGDYRDRVHAYYGNVGTNEQPTPGRHDEKESNLPQDAKEPE